MHFLDAKYAISGWGSTQDPTRVPYSAPQTLSSAFKGAYSKARGGQRRRGEGKKGKKGGRRGKGKGRVIPVLLSPL